MSIKSSIAWTLADRRSVETTTERRGRNAISPRPRVLIVEYQDEIYGALETVLEEAGCEVARAATSDSVLTVVNCLTPSLIIINADMPDQSGWLIAAKLRLSNCRDQVWLYLASPSLSPASWQSLAGVDKVIEYDAIFTQCLQTFEHEAFDWLAEFRGTPAIIRSG